MKTLNLQAIPNQTISFVDNQNLFDIAIKSVLSVTTCSISVNNTPILANTRIITGFPIILYPYLETGNFVLLTNSDELPDYTQFGITQFLIYGNQEELNAIRAT